MHSTRSTSLFRKHYKLSAEQTKQQHFCIKAPDQKPFFYTSINTSGIIQNSSAVAAAILQVIEKIGSQKFTSFISDNAPVMKSAWRIIEEKYPHISASGCGAHRVNLLVKDIVSTTEA